MDWWVAIAGVVLGLIPLFKMLIVAIKMIVTIIAAAVLSSFLELPFRVIGLIISTLFALEVLAITWALSWLAWTYTPKFWESVNRYVTRINNITARVTNLN
mgnify:CR=1 FL=1